MLRWVDRLCFSCRRTFEKAIADPDIHVVYVYILVTAFFALAWKTCDEHAAQGIDAREVSSACYKYVYDSIQRILTTYSNNSVLFVNKEQNKNYFSQ